MPCRQPAPHQRWRGLGSYLFSQGRVIYNTYATFIALGVTLALDLVLIPTLYWYRQVSGGSVWEALVFRPSDRRIYGDL